jgi:hypothetical protein
MRANPEVGTLETDCGTCTIYWSPTTGSWSDPSTRQCSDHRCSVRLVPSSADRRPSEASKSRRGNCIKRLRHHGNQEIVAAVIRPGLRHCSRKSLDLGPRNRDFRHSRNRVSGLRPHILDYIIFGHEPSMQLC